MFCLLLYWILLNLEGGNVLCITTSSIHLQYIQFYNTTLYMYSIIKIYIYICVRKIQSIPVSKKRIQSPKSRIPSWWNCAICNSCALQKYVEIRWSSLEFLQTVCVTYSLSWTTNSWWDCAIYRPLHALLSKLSCVIAPSITVTLSSNEEIFLGISA